jgi:lipoate-protein ligase A
MTMHCYDRTLPTVPENLALDEALLLLAEAGQLGECLRFWDSPTYAVVLGANGVRGEEVNLEVCEREGVPVYRRSSGGGTVLLGPGCLQYSLVLSYERAAELTNVLASYRWIMERVRHAFIAVGAVKVHGTSDLCVEQRKFSGNAQQRKTHCLLHHGTLLYDFDLPQIERYLPMPPRMPDYRETRAHDAFVRNIPLDVTTLKHLLMSQFEAHMAEVPEEVWGDVSRLTTEKFANATWLERR